MAVKIVMKPTNEILAVRGLGSNGYAQKVLVSEIYRESDKYTPFRSGKLKQTTTLGKDFIHYRSPYARRMWYGKVLIGPAPQEVTDKDITYQGAPMRGAFWCTRMWTDKKKIISTKVAKLVGGRAE